MRVFLVALFAALGVQAGYYHPSSTSVQQPSAYPIYYNTQPASNNNQYQSYTNQQPYPSHVNTQQQQQQYPSNINTNQQIYPSNIITNQQLYPSNINTNQQIYPSNIITNQQLYPSNINTNQQQYPSHINSNQQQYPSNINTNQQIYPSNINTNQQQYPSYINTHKAAYNNAVQQQQPQYQTGFVPITNHQNNYYEVNHSSENNVYESGSSSASGNLVSNENQQISDNGGSLSQAYDAGYVSQVVAASSQAPTSPVITKHIYFHAPPPEIEEPIPQIPSTQRKKIYNIVFIKVPSQKASRGAAIQVATAAQRAPVEDKTLIYLLVKKPEPQPVLPPAPVSSQHEVFYVKYKGDVSEVVGRINGGLGQQPGPVSSGQLQSNLQNVVAQSTGTSALGELQPPLPNTFQPGLTNGQI